MEQVTMNLAQAADALGVSRPTMRALVHRSNFPAFRVGTRWLISRAALEEWSKDAAFNRIELEGIKK